MEFVSSKGEPTTIILINEHITKLTYKYLSLYLWTTAALISKASLF